MIRTICRDCGKQTIVEVGDTIDIGSSIYHIYRMDLNRVSLTESNSDHYTVDMGLRKDNIRRDIKNE